MEKVSLELHRRGCPTDIHLVLNIPVAVAPNLGIRSGQCLDFSGTQDPVVDAHVIDSSAEPTSSIHWPIPNGYGSTPIRTLDTHAIDDRRTVSGSAVDVEVN